MFAKSWHIIIGGLEGCLSKTSLAIICLIFLMVRVR